jgi:pyruvate formate lyase activating enzyme
VTGFHQDYKMNDPADTKPKDLLRAAAIGQASGLRYVYAGNLPGQVGELENTRCAECAATLIRRHGYLIDEYAITPEGRCPRCGKAVPGRWAPEFRGQLAHQPFLPHRRQPLVTIHTRR